MVRMIMDGFLIFVFDNFLLNCSIPFRSWKMKILIENKKESGVDALM